MKWPLHPSPIRGERLSSWLRRVALEYGLDIRELLRLGLGVQQLPYGWPDWRLPDDFMMALSSKTGLLLDTLARTTFTGMLPFLFSGTAVKRSVLLPPGQYPFRGLHDWLPWFRTELGTEMMVCRLCLKNYPNAGIMLPWRLTLVLSCPDHRLMLEAAHVYPDSVCWRGSVVEEVPEMVHDLDTRIWNALTLGYVELPGGKVQAVDWFRLIQAIQDELSRKVYGYCDQRLIWRVWSEADCCPQAGAQRWPPLESLSPHRRRSMVISTAIHLIEQGSIAPAGVDASLFQR